MAISFFLLIKIKKALYLIPVVIFKCGFTSLQDHINKMSPSIKHKIYLDSSLLFTEKGIVWKGIAEAINKCLGMDIFLQVGITESEAKTILNQHNWWKGLNDNEAFGYGVITTSIPAIFLSPGHR